MERLRKVHGDIKKLQKVDHVAVAQFLGMAILSGMGLVIVRKKKRNRMSSICGKNASPLCL